MVGKIRKMIRVHRELRIQQEVYCGIVVNNAQQLPFKDNPEASAGLARLNKAVRNINNKMPSIYFFLSDLFGCYNIIKKEANRRLKELGYNFDYDGNEIIEK